MDYQTIGLTAGGFVAGALAGHFVRNQVGETAYSPTELPDAPPEHLAAMGLGGLVGAGAGYGADKRLVPANTDLY